MGAPCLPRTANLTVQMVAGEGVELHLWSELQTRGKGNGGLTDPGFAIIKGCENT